MQIPNVLKRFIERKIQEQMNKNGVFLGKGTDILSGNNEFVFIPWPVLNRHTYLLGATGSGKTTLLRNIAYQIALSGAGVLFLDMKGGETTEKVIRDLYLACINSGRPEAFTLISPVDVMGIPSAQWNPLFHGNDGVVANKLYEAFRSFSENAKFYEDVKFDVLLKIVTAMKKTKKAFTFSTMVQALRSPDHLRELARIAGGKEGEALIDMASEWETNKMQFVKNVKGTLVNLQMLSMSYPAKILETITPTFVLSEAVEKHKVIYCLLPTLYAKESMRQIAKMLLSELKTLAGDLCTSRKKANFFVIIDEFEEVAFSSVRDLFNKAREAGINLIVGHQTVADIEFETSESFAESIMDNTATKIFLQMKSAKSAELAAKTIGQYPAIPLVSKWIHLKYLIEPDIFMGKNSLRSDGLQIGEAIVKVDANIYRVKIFWNIHREKIKLGKDIPFPKPNYIPKHWGQELKIIP